MKKKIKGNLLVLLSCLCVFSLLGFLSYNYYINKNINNDINEIKNEQQNSSDLEKLSQNNKQNELKKQEIKELESNVQENVESVNSGNGNKILTTTKLVFRYCYVLDNKVIEEIKDPMYFMLNMTKDEVIKQFPDWQIQSFSEEKVVLEKKINKKNEAGYFIIGEYQGHIAVFYNDGRLREITQTIVASLPEEEQEWIKEGIQVYGEDELIRILEDYTS